MTKLNKILASVFAVQILLTGVIFLGSQPPDADTLQTALLTADKTIVDRITIEGNEGQKTLLSKINGQWQLPEYHQLPANQSQVRKAVDQLAQTKSGWPIATTGGSHERFEVSDNKFKTRITLASGDEVLEKIYLGTSPGFRHLHVRKSGDDEVYSVKLNDFDYPATNDSWLDRALIKAGNNITLLSGPDFEIKKQGDGWAASGEALEVVPEQVEQLVDTLASLNINKAVDKKLEKPNYQLKVKTADKEYNYSFYKDGTIHYVKRNDHSLAFEVSKPDFEKITGKTATQLTKLADDENSDTIADNEQKNKDDQNS